MTPEARLPELRLKAGEDRRLRSGHLWVYSNEVDVGRTPLKAFEPGDLARLVSDKGRFLGYAGVNPHSLISARILSRDESRPPDQSLITHRLKVALAWRERVYPGGFYRLVFGESDLLPGLVIDRFGDYAVLQAGTAAIESRKGQVVDAVCKVLKPSGVLWRNDSAAREIEGLERYREVAMGEVPPEVPVIEGGVTFQASLQEGQKTGWFYDQRDNRQRFSRYAAATVLDVFCYAGAWGLTAASNGSRSSFVDSSGTALAAVEAVAQTLGVEVETIRGSAFEMMRALRDEGRKFDAVIVDPPAFIKRRKDYKQGLAAYQRINQLAMLLLANDGLLVSCSCSHHLTAEELVSAIQRAARHVDRFVQVLEIGGQSVDHPIHPAIPETRYLKAIFCRVLPA